MTVINYPRNRPQQFLKLFLIATLFIAGFFWIIPVGEMVHGYLGVSFDKAAIGLFVGNVAAISIGGMWMAMRWRNANDDDVTRVYAMPLLSKQDREWLMCNCPADSFVIHSVEGRWPSSSPRRLPRDLYVEFLDDQTRVMFQIAREGRHQAA